MFCEVRELRSRILPMMPMYMRKAAFVVDVEPVGTLCTANYTTGVRSSSTRLIQRIHESQNIVLPFACSAWPGTRAQTRL